MANTEKTTTEDQKKPVIENEPIDHSENLATLIVMGDMEAAAQYAYDATKKTIK